MKTNDKFEKLIRKSCNNVAAESVFALFLLFGLSLFMLYWGIKAKLGFFFILGIGIAIVGIFVAKRNKGDLKGGTYWIDIIENNPEDIIWIKPITTKHTVGIVVTLYREKKFQLLTKDGVYVTMKCNSEEDQSTLFQGIRDHFSHSQIGYSPEINSLYKSNPKEFLASLKNKRLYTPISSFGM